MKPLPRDEQRISEEAAAWLEALARGGAAEREAFAAWVKESPRHVRAFLLMTAVDIELDGVDAGHKHEAVVPAGNVVALGNGKRTAGKQNTALMRRSVAWAAGLAATAVAALTLLNLFGVPQYSTGIGEQRAFTLPDGSVVYLNTDSCIALDFSERAREIRLREGEALFKVARDSARPFRVRTDDTVIQAIGTQFNVRQDQYGTEVAVLEGQVRVADQTKPFSAGEGATIRRNAPGIKRASADVEQVTAWRERRLMFRSDTLADIAAEFNRYNRAPHIRVSDAALGERRFSGVFDAEDPESFAAVLEGSGDLTVERSEHEILIREQRR